jgi:hypothetical protein
MESEKEYGYIIKKPITEYETERDCPWKFYNGEDVSLADAVDNITTRKESFTAPNSDLLALAINGSKWR